jgi:tryptophanyl-tRNA synthetase
VKDGARVMAFDDPTTKMSKSAPNELSRISLLDEPGKIKKAIMRATTDSDGEIRFDMENKPGISNLLNVYSVLAGIPVADVEKRYSSQGYGSLKKDLVEITVDALAPIKSRFDEIRHTSELIEILKDGAERAEVIAEKTMKRVREKVGLGVR